MRRVFGFFVCGCLLAQAALAQAPELGPSPGTMAVVQGNPGETKSIYKTQKVWEDADSNTPPSLMHSIEAGAKVKISKRASLDDNAWFLSQVSILSGSHKGETRWIHSRYLRVIPNVVKRPSAAKPSGKTVRTKGGARQ